VSRNDLGGHVVALLDRWFEAFNAHDVDACCEIADPAIEVIPLTGETSPPGTRYHGREGLRTLLNAGFDRFPRLRLRHAEPRPVGDDVAVALEFILDDTASPPDVRRASCEYRIRGGHIRRMRAYESSQPRSRSSLLSPREREVLALLAGGNTVQEIATDLSLSPLTVRTHVRNAKDKLRARTTAHAVAIALDEDVLSR
jgi:DNA-binding CsgD family transcriptional regulator